jgi:hypothetical protein
MARNRDRLVYGWGRPLLLLAEDLIGPFHQRHQIRRSDKPGILAIQVGIADRTGP